MLTGWPLAWLLNLRFRKVKNQLGTETTWITVKLRHYLVGRSLDK